jgi:ABC-type multidrug transport system ATPase subunit
MPSYADIERLTFGKSIAESEANALRRYFVTTQAYMNAKTPERRKTYYIGQRGAGKSALLNQLATEFENEGDNITLQITPHDFSYELFKAREHDYIDVRSVYAAVWHYTLMIQLFKQTVEYFGDNPHLKTNRENVGRLRKYLLSKALLDAESILEIFFSFLTELTAQKNINRLQNISSDGGVKRDKHVLRILHLTEIASEVKALEIIGGESSRLHLHRRTRYRVE